MLSNANVLFVKSIRHKVGIHVDCITDYYIKDLIMVSENDHHIKTHQTQFE
jgi:hypothetical protein